MQRVIWAQWQSHLPSKWLYCKNKLIKNLLSCLAALCTMLVNKTPRLKPFNGLGLTQFQSPSKTINQLVCERMCRLKNSSPQAALFCYLQKVGLDFCYTSSLFISNKAFYGLTSLLLHLIWALGQTYNLSC